MNLDVPVSDERRIEVVANGLPLWHGSQLALDATTRRGEAHPRADVQPSCAVAAAARRKRTQTYTYPELDRARRCRLVVVGVEVGGRFGTEAVQFLRLLAGHRAASVPAHLRSAAVASWVALSLPSAPTQPRSSNSPLPPSWARGPCLPCMRSLPMRAGVEGARCWYRAGCRSVAGSELLLHWDRRTPVAKRSAKKKTVKPTECIFPGMKLNRRPTTPKDRIPKEHEETKPNRKTSATNRKV